MSAPVLRRRDAVEPAVLTTDDIERFQRCEASWALRYVDGVEPEAPPSPAAFEAARHAWPATAPDRPELVEEGRHVTATIDTSYGTFDASATVDAIERAPDGSTLIVGYAAGQPPETELDDDGEPLIDLEAHTAHALAVATYESETGDRVARLDVRYPQVRRTVSFDLDEPVGMVDLANGLH